MDSKNLFSSSSDNLRSSTCAISEVESNAPKSGYELELSRLGKVMDHKLVELSRRHEELVRRHKALKKKHRALVSKVKKGKIASSGSFEASALVRQEPPKIQIQIPVSEPVLISSKIDACVGPDISIELKLPMSQKEWKIYSEIERIFAEMIDLNYEHIMERTLEMETGINRSSYSDTILEAGRELADHISDLVVKLGWEPDFRLRYESKMGEKREAGALKPRLEELIEAFPLYRSTLLRKVTGKKTSSSEAIQKATLWTINQR